MMLVQTLKVHMKDLQYIWKYFAQLLFRPVQKAVQTEELAICFSVSASVLLTFIFLDCFAKLILNVL